MPDLDVIDGDGPGKEERDRERDRERASNEFSSAIRDTAANMLRIVRGAGKPYELLLQTKRTIDSAIKFRELHDYWPTDVIANTLRLEDAREALYADAGKGKYDQASIDRWLEDGTIDQMLAEGAIFRGALQAIASELIGQTLQKRSGRKCPMAGARWYLRRRPRAPVTLAVPLTT